MCVWLRTKTKHTLGHIAEAHNLVGVRRWSTLATEVWSDTTLSAHKRVNLAKLINHLASVSPCKVGGTGVPTSQGCLEDEVT
jgi:hypothetical protein